MGDDLRHDVSDPGITITRVFEAPREAYTRALIEAVPIPDPALARSRRAAPAAP